MAELPEHLLILAAQYAGIPYVLGGNDASGIDCSGYVLAVLRAGGLPLDGVRTAEQIRQAAIPVSWDQVQPGDLIFGEHTYEPDEAAGPDGRTASHVMLSLGVGSRRCWSAQEPVVTEIELNDWWQGHLIEARRHPQIAATPLPTTLNASLGFDACWPVIQKYADLYAVDGRVIAAVCAQESSFVNRQVHDDGSGHGLFGLDDAGGLIEFERWCGSSFGRSVAAGSIAPVLQIEFVCSWFAAKVAEMGSTENACRVWHRGPSLWQDGEGASYAQLIVSHVRDLFG